MFMDDRKHKISDRGHIVRLAIFDLKGVGGFDGIVK